MTREQFLDLVRHPELTATVSTDSIASLAGQFPYCQPLRYLYLKQLAVNDSVQYPQQLKVTASLAPDRTRLFRLIHPEPDGPTSDDVMAGIYESASPAVPAQDTDETPAPVFEPIVAAEITSSLPEYEAPTDEAKMSVEEIVNQRLKELNLWQEPENLPADSVFPSGEEQTTETSEQEPTETAALPESTLYTAAETPAEREPESLLTDLPAFVPAAAELNPPAETVNSIATTPPPAEEQAQDPLEDIIRESLAESRLRNSEYFNDKLPEEIEAADVAPLTEQPAPDTPTTYGHTEENYTTHTREIHSFSDWLKLNHPPEEKKEPTPAAETMVPEAVQTAAAGNPESAESPAFTTVAERQEETPAQEAETSPSLTAGIYENTTADTRAGSPVAHVKFIFVKSEAMDTPDSTAAETPVQVYAAPVTSADPRPAVEPEQHQPGVSTVPEENQAAETIFTGEIIPPRKPIPDPSLVDTDPPKPRVPAGELIDKFIREEPRITPSKSTFYSPSNMAKKSILEPDDLVTETLASIYAQQGNFKKAISFYQKLSLKFPEKSRYFAALIEELKKKSNS